MKRLLACLLFMTSAYISFSQKNFFVYIQSETGQPFQLKLGEKTLNSSASGYIIIPKLIDSTYSLSLYLSQQNEEPQQYKVQISKKDHGFLLKKFEGKGWGLFHLQTMSVLMPIGKNSESASSGKNTDASPFTEVLSKASGDPSLKEKKEVVQPNPEKKEIIPAEKLETKPATEQTSLTKVDSPAVKSVEIAVINKSENNVVEEVKQNSPSSVEYKPSVVTKKSESSTTEGFGLIYTDVYSDGKADTIKLIIANPKEPASITKVVEQQAPSKIEEKAVSGEGLVKSNCVVVAAESDFFELRKKMAAAENDEAMIAEAKAYCRTKCFTTLQFKNLCTLFLTDEGRYKFFDAVYDYTADPVNFTSLQSELKDEYYINRFKAMLRK